MKKEEIIKALYALDDAVCMTDEQPLTEENLKQIRFMLKMMRELIDNFDEPLTPQNMIDFISLKAEIDRIKFN